MLYQDLQDKKVLVTGSSSGIGAATAELFAQQGARVGVHYNQTEDGARQTLAKVKALSDGWLLKADLRNPQQAADMVSRFADQASGIDILVNNAGTMLERVNIADSSVEFFDNVFDTNTKSVFLVTRAALPCLKQSHGNIVNIGSIAGHNGGGGGSGIYAAAKAAVATLTLAMAKEFAPFGIRVNSVMPGLIETRFHEQFSTPERKKKMAAETPLGRNGTAEDVAKAILFLASNEAAAFITGEYIAVNGGILMRP
ncbi:MAG TPA: SDR family NAD(P)-dependent oxidoreductase [Anaerohalosphaeraceae bacterium]|nr:SDR family NAD(P)-dependent oxidoreductase [Anaerohalosphaeraceae bacterium]